MIRKEAGVFTEDTAINISRFAVVTSEVESTDVSPPTADVGLEDVAPALIMVEGVSFPGALRAPRDSFPAAFVPAPVALFWEVAVLFNKIMVTAGVAGAKLAEISTLRGRMGRGRAGGCVHVVGRSNKGVFGNGG
jgi:hypothetical protein